MESERLVPEEEQSTCALCGQPISEDEVRFCLANAGRFKGLAFCQEHQKRFSACSAMRWQPGKGEQLR